MKRASIGWMAFWLLGVVVPAAPAGPPEEPAAATSLPPPADVKADFARDIRPVLAARCLGCHGPDRQESHFRLDRRESLLKGGDMGEPAVVPGRSAESHLVRYVADPKADLRMPPEGERLSAKEVGLLRAWIDQGAVMPDADDDEPPTTGHWSFQPIQDRPPPAVNDPWIANPIDAFVLAKLKEKGLGTSAPVGPATLVRRLWLDVLGLPPPPEEIEAFARDPSPAAYARLVDRALASPHYGERWARHWLDVVRFAETDGFEMNQERPNAYPYRDYVIRSLNQDKPYDQFLLDQLAGDATGEDAATGFLVGGAYDKVKSPDPVLTGMQRQDELADMVNTTGTAMLGLTLGCARCHSHKFDPIPQKDYYAIQAVFAGVKHGDRPLRVPDSPQRRKQAEELQAEIASAEKELSTLESGAALAPGALRPPVNPQRNVEQFPPVTARFVRFTVAATNSGAEPCLDELEIFAAEEEKDRNVALASAGAKATSSSNFPGNPRHKLEHVHDGQYGNDRSWISAESGRGWVQIELARAARIDRVVWGRDRKGQFTDRVPVQYVIEAAAEPGKWQTVAGSHQRQPLPTGAGAGDRFAGLPKEAAEQGRKLLARIESLRKRHEALTSGPMAYAGLFETPGPTHRLNRGDALQPREAVAPDALSVLRPRLGPLRLAPDAPEQARRLALARWIARPDNPLTARVMVNRIWQHHFGTGIVASPSDFGRMGEPPSHPELLDWLAGEFIRAGWSMKHMHRLVLLSGAYRQSSAPSAQGLAADAGSRLLWRFPPRRLEAEAIRDNVLAVTGVLDSAMYGPGYSAFEPNDNYVRVYEPRKEWGPAQWRRMVYMTKVRMQNDAVFGTFDTPDAGQVCPRRSRSTTALQALNLLNSSFMVQQSELFAGRLRREAGETTEAQVRRAFALAFGRAPDQEEAAAAGKVAAEHGLPALCRALLNANEFLFLP